MNCPICGGEMHMWNTCAATDGKCSNPGYDCEDCDWSGTRSEADAILAKKERTR